MQLTERQCWKIIRQLVTDKNNEYKQFLKDVFDFNKELGNFGKFDTEQIKQIQGYTRDAFLYKCGFSNMTKFYEEVSGNGKEPNNRWHENLSCEDLLLFLDFRCRSLQSIYNYYAKQGKINKYDIKQIVDETKLSPLKHYRGGVSRLRCQGKPARVEGEQKLSSLDLSTEDMQELAISQILTSMAGQYIARGLGSTNQVQDIVNNVVTHNVNMEGNITGYKLKTEIILKQTKRESKSEVARISTDQPRPTINAPKLAGFDANKRTIFIKEGVQVDLIGQKVQEREIVYDPNGKLIEYSDEHTI